MKKNIWLFILAILVGLIYLAPQVFYQLSLGKDFQGVYRGVNDDELYYMARAQEVVDGHYLLSNPYFVDYKNSDSMQVFLPDLIAAWPAKAFGISVYPLYEFYDFLLPAIAFILLYLILFSLVKNFFWANVIAFGVMVVEFFPSLGRPISPQLVFIFALTLILLLRRLLDGSSMDRRRFWFVVLAGLNFGLLFYIYTYLWTYFTVILSLLLVYFLLKKKFLRFKEVFLVMVIGLVSASYYFYQVWLSSQSAFFAESIQRLGMVDTRIPSGIQIVVPIFIVLVLHLCFFLNQKKKGEDVSEWEVFLVSGLLSAIINVNSHIITGKNLLFSSHYQIIADIFIILGLVYLLWRFNLTKFLATRNVMKYFFVLLIIILFLPNFLRVLKYDKSYELRRQDYQVVFNWLNKNTAKDSVVMANNDLSAHIPSYTKDNVLFAFGGNLFFVSTAEIIDRFVVNNYWQENFNADFVKYHFKSIFGYYYNALAGKEKQLNLIRRILGRPLKNLDEICYPADKIGEIINDKNQMTVDEWREKIKNYKVVYIVIDKTTDNWEGGFSQLLAVDPSFENTRFSIFQISP